MRKLYDQCMEELDGVKEYSTCAMSSQNPELSKMYRRKKIILFK